MKKLPCNCQDGRGDLGPNGHVRTDDLGMTHFLGKHTLYAVSLLNHKILDIAYFVELFCHLLQNYNYFNHFLVYIRKRQSVCINGFLLSHR